MRSPHKRAPLDAEGLWALALKTLAAHACSAGELREKLRVRAGHAEDVESVLARLKDYRYLDDRRFAESFVAQRLENQRLGRSRVVRDLRGRRVAPALAEATVKKAYQDVDEAALVEEYVRRKYRKTAAAELFQDEKELASAYRRLTRAGFSTGHIIRVLKRFAANPELLDTFEPPASAEEE